MSSVQREEEAAEMDEYTLYMFYISYFSGKMQGYLRYKEIPHRCVEPDWWRLANEIYPQTGLMKVPVLQTPDGQWLQDSTPMIEWLEEKHPEGAILPDDPYLVFFCRLVEDYADEWLWRPALHYRWSPPMDGAMLALRFSYEFLSKMPMPRWMTILNTRLRQDRIYIKGDGICPETRGHVEGVYLNNLSWLQALLSRQPYLLGDRPSLADFGYFASMFRHFSLDPTPSRLMRERAPAVYAWVARLWNTRHSEISADWPEVLPEGWGPILDDVGEAYLPYLHANAQAWVQGKKRFSIELQGTLYKDLPVVQYRVWCRERLQEHIEALPEDAKHRVQETLERHGCWEPLWRDGVLPSRLHEETTPPLCQPRKVGFFQKLWLFFTGTHWHVPGAKQR